MNLSHIFIYFFHISLKKLFTSIPNFLRYVILTKHFNIICLQGINNCMDVKILSQSISDDIM